MSKPITDPSEPPFFKALNGGILGVLLLLSFGCTDSDDRGPATSADFKFGTESYLLRGDLSGSINTGGLGQYSLNSFASVYGNGFALFLGTHARDSVVAILGQPGSAQKHAETTLQVLENFDSEFVGAINVVQGADRDCFTCYAIFTDTVATGFSLTFIKSISDLSKKEIWTSAYGSQTSSSRSLVIRKAEVVKAVDPRNKWVYYHVVVSLEFSCVVYDESGNSRTLIGNLVLPAIQYKD